MEDAYVQHGPTGYPGVSATTTNDIMIFAIEADGNDCTCLPNTSCNTSSQGDWLTGTSHPTVCVVNPANSGNTIAADYQTGFFWPYIYMVCPDRTVTLIGQQADPYSFVSNCAVASIAEPIENNISISPNPVKTDLKIDLKEGMDGEFVIVDLNGAIVFSTEILASELSKILDLTSLKSGLYFVKLGNSTIKFTKN